jgi:hypothetical protein
MKRIVLYIFILFSPFLFIALINEIVSDGEEYVIKSEVIAPGQKFYALNSDRYLNDKCSWSCHNDGCNHKSVIYHGKIKEMYDGIIHFNLHQSINYSEMNVFLFVIVVPLLVYILIILNIEVYLRNKKKRLS